MTKTTFARLFVAAGAAVVLLAVPVASSAAPPHHPNARVVRLSRTVQKLRGELRARRIEQNQAVLGRNQALADLGAANTALAAASSARAAASNELAAANSQIGSLEAVVAERTAERDAALRQSASLRAQLAAIPTPFAVAVEQVRREVAWAQHGTEGSTWAPHGPSSYSLGEVTALSALNYTVGHVSASAYGYLQITGGQLPIATPDSVLAAQAGFCGSAALTFAALVEHFGYEVRSVQFYFTTPGGAPDDHIAVEVYYDGGWHYFDPTFGVFWTDTAGNVLSIADVRAGAGVEHTDAASFTNLLEDPWFDGDDVAFETDPATVVELNQQPFSG
jgi:hypothetical protein